MHDTEGETIDDVKRERDEWKARAGTEREAHTATLERMMKVATWHADAERERDELSRIVVEMSEILREITEAYDLRTARDNNSHADLTIIRARRILSHRDGDYLAVTHTVSAGTYAKRVDERDAAERSRDELGIQLEALRERMQLAMAVVEAARRLAAVGFDSARWQTIDTKLKPALDAFDTVPGDEK